MPRLETLNLRRTKVTTPGLRQLKGLTEHPPAVGRRIACFGIACPTSSGKSGWPAPTATTCTSMSSARSSCSSGSRSDRNPHGLSATADGRTVHVALEHFDDPVGRDRLDRYQDIQHHRRGSTSARTRRRSNARPTASGSTSPAPTASGTSSMASRSASSRRSTPAAGRTTRSCSPDGKRMYLSPMGYPHAVTVVDIDAGHKVIGEIPFKDVTRPPAITARRAALLPEHRQHAGLPGGRHRPAASRSRRSSISFPSSGAASGAAATAWASVPTSRKSGRATSSTTWSTCTR